VNGEMSETVNEKKGGTHSLNNSSTHMQREYLFQWCYFGITISLLGLFRWANERYSLKCEDGNLL